tara:strand:+ start:719 stop:877 length:159 start_codon:yes stop_codon:yes gene_type:complete
MSINWGIIGVMIGTMLIWYSVFQNGFFTTLLWLIIIGLIIGIILRLKEEMRV